MIQNRKLTKPLHDSSRNDFSRFNHDFQLYILFDFKPKKKVNSRDQMIWLTTAAGAGTTWFTAKATAARSKQKEQLRRPGQAMEAKPHAGHDGGRSPAGWVTTKNGHLENFKNNLPVEAVESTTCGAKLPQFGTFLFFQQLQIKKKDNQTLVFEDIPFHTKITITPSIPYFSNWWYK